MAGAHGPGKSGPVEWNSAVSARPYDGVEFSRLDFSNMTLVRYSLEAGAAHPLHDHPEEQVVVVISGRLKFTIAEADYELSPGDAAYVPGGVTHGACAHEEPCLFYNFVAPRRS